MNVTLSQMALEQFAVRGETMLVSAYYFEGPKTTAVGHANGADQIDLSSKAEEIEVPGVGGPARITGSYIVARRFDW